ncbi:MAG: phosphotransferase [Bacteroidetes bacterium]|jgi:fructosamine-3-kinase|nr:phosphotransferase [Bacteroidota bacterium]
MISEALKHRLHENIDIEIVNVRRLSGGDINHAFRISSTDGDYFLKYNTKAPDDFFEKEALGLQKLCDSATGLRIPKVVATGKPDHGTPGFLLMEYIPTGSTGNSTIFGQELARMHSTRGDYYGLEFDNYIGSLPQKNSAHKEWITFFAEERIEPQLKMAFQSGKLSSGLLKNWSRMVKELPSIFPPSKPSLLHGDLWGGNYLFDENGTAVLIDPAVYYGHPEMDLAFTKMFGGFSTSFYDGYKSVTPLEDDFSNRVPIYNLYPLLVHVNLFGGHYVSQFERIVGRY